LQILNMTGMSNIHKIINEDSCRMNLLQYDEVKQDCKNFYLLLSGFIESTNVDNILRFKYKIKFKLL
jgi:hypothetical protein